MEEKEDNRLHLKDFESLTTAQWQPVCSYFCQVCETCNSISGAVLLLVVVVKWSACSPYTLMIRVRDPMKSNFFPVNCC